jgi:hypothetical protein
MTRNQVENAEKPLLSLVAPLARCISERIKMSTIGGWRIVEPEIYKLLNQLSVQVRSFRILREIRRIWENVRIVRAYEGETNR